MSLKLQPGCSSGLVTHETHTLRQLAAVTPLRPAAFDATSRPTFTYLVDADVICPLMYHTSTLTLAQPSPDLICKQLLKQRHPLPLWRRHALLLLLLKVLLPCTRCSAPFLAVLAPVSLSVQVRIPVPGQRAPAPAFGRESTSRGW